MTQQSGRIRVNAFRLHTVDKIPECLYQYRVEIRRVIGEDGTVDTEDITEKRSNDVISIAVVSAMLLNLGISPARGVTYDGSHLLCSVFPLSPDDDIQVRSSASVTSGEADDSSTVFTDTGKALREYTISLPSGMSYRVKLLVLANMLRPLSFGNTFPYLVVMCQ